MTMHNNHARMLRVRRSATASPSPSATAIVDSNGSSNIADTVNLTVPTVTKTLEIVVAILVLVILAGVGICFFRRWKRNQKKVAPSQLDILDFTSEKTRKFEMDNKLDLHASAYMLERPDSVYIPGVSSADMNPAWVPQMSAGNAQLASSASTSSKKSKGSKKKKSLRESWDKSLPRIVTSERSPPPSYMSNGQAVLSLPLPPSPPLQSTIAPTPPTPPASKTKNPFSRDNAPPAPPKLLMPTNPVPQPILSPRSASFGAHQSMAFSAAALDRPEDTKLAVVINPFTPTMEDELSIQVGQTLRVLEEFQDGWALVQHVGRSDAPKGVVPQTCLAERSLPLAPNRRL